MYALSVRSLRKSYADKPALDDLDFSMEREVSRLGILGNNGAGKSTFLRVLVGLIEADSGTVELSNETPVRFATVTSSLGTFVGEHSNVLPNVTGRRYLRLYRGLCSECGIPYSEELQEDFAERLSVAQFLGKACREMSKGNQRKVEIVATLAAQAPLYIADEITDGLDAASRLVLSEIIRQYPVARQFIISSHDVDFLAAVSERVVTIDHGRVTGAYERGSQEAHEFHKQLVDAMRLTLKDRV